MWVHYIRETQSVLILHMTSFDKVQLMEVKKEGDPRIISDVEIKNINCVHQQGDCFYFASNVEDNMPIYIATIKGIKKISFEIKSDVTPIEFGFLKEGLLFMLYNTVGVKKKDYEKKNKKRPFYEYYHKFYIKKHNLVFFNFFFF